jgi:hypothetical protein
MLPAKHIGTSGATRSVVKLGSILERVSNGLADVISAFIDGKAAIVARDSSGRKTADTAGDTASNKPYAVADTADSGAPTAKGGLIGYEAVRCRCPRPIAGATKATLRQVCPGNCILDEPNGPRISPATCRLFATQR